jgi:TonB family protein
MNEERKDKLKGIKFREFLFLSALVHFLLVYILVDDTFFPKHLTRILDKPVNVYVGDEEYRKQVVVIDDAEPSGDPDPRARYLSQVNKKVLRESRARNWGKPFNIKEKVVQSIVQEALDRAIDQYLEARANDKAKKELNKENKESSTYDYLPDVRAGDFTALNTAEFIYYSFYRRVEDSIVYLWNQYINEYVSKYPDVRANLKNRDYVTEVEAILDAEGNFTRMYVIRSSGVAGIDEAPGKAFAEASPFENPPKGMVEDENKIRMRWRFIVSVVEQVKFNIEQIDYDYYRRLGYPDPALRRN